MAILRTIGWCLLWTATLRAQAPNAPRDLKIEGVKFTLPARAWAYKGPGQRISLTTTVLVSGRMDEATAELFFFERRFINDRILEFEAMAKSSPNDYDGLEVKTGERFGSEKAVLVVYKRSRGDPPREYRRRHLLFRRYGHLYEWVEEVPCDVESQLGSSFSAARRALSFGVPENPAVTEWNRDFVNQRVKFTLDKDWTWAGGAEGPKVELDFEKQSGLLFSARSETLEKNLRYGVQVTLTALKTSATLDAVVQGNKHLFTKDVKNLEGFEIAEKQRFAGQSAQRVSYSGMGRGSDVRGHYDVYVFKHRGHVFLWTEAQAQATADSTGKLFLQARKGLKIY